MILMLQSIAFIPDGNRRFARKHSIDLLRAYELGFKTAEKVLNWCLKLPYLKVVTMYALSTENLRRKSVELSILKKLFRKYLREFALHKKLHDNEVKVKIIGKRDALPDLREDIRYLEEKTQDYKKYELNIALGYGGRDELINAIKALKLNGEKVTEENIKKHLYMPHDVDLIVRTGSYQRLSNFLPWQAVYSELYFSKRLWPEFDRREFNKAIDFYRSTQRNFGK
ncbi:di-trans,poly-cis-decaprenylcistransferase [Candidatus Micrarchaeota archaeon]|nr:MAG: di-trans,poly-cis-decaprenylcistransferase [Candidatus Micrarchaeota archaeon]